VKDQDGRDCIKFLAREGVPVVIAASVKRSVDTTRYWYERAAHTGLAQLSELANLPMVAPGVLLGFGKRKGASRHTFLSSRGT